MGAAAIWRDAKQVVLPFEGAASQFHVLDLPISGYGKVLDCFVKFVGEAEVVEYDGECDRPRILDEGLRAALLSDGARATLHKLRGLHDGRESLTLYAWLNSKPGSFDIDLVFWSDELFPNPDDESACLFTFEKYVGFIEKVRSLSADSRCVLSASEAGDPRRDCGKPWTYCW